MAVELIVFDLAGTTVKDNFDVHRVMQKTLARFEIIISLENANEVMGLPKPLAIYKLVKKSSNGKRPISEEYVDEIHNEFVADMIDFYKTDARFGEKEGVTETFKKIKRS